MPSLESAWINHEVKRKTKTSTELKQKAVQPDHESQLGWKTTNTMFAQSAHVGFAELSLIDAGCKHFPTARDIIILLAQI